MASPTKTWPVLLVVGIGTLLSAMSGSAVTLALPNIGSAFELSISYTRWIVLSFLLAVTVTMLIVGRLGDLLTHRLIYLWGFFLFGVMSLLCGLAHAFWLLLVARVLQGLGGAMVMATAPALLTTSVPSRERGRALGIASTATYTGLTVGPPLGGWLIGSFGWRAVFLLNVPVALIMVVIGPRMLPKTTRQPTSAPFDWAGALMMIGGLTPLLLAISQAEHWGWGAPLTLTVLGLGTLGTVAFVLVERRRHHPLVDLALFCSRVFSGAVLSALCNYIALFAPIILLPYLLIEGCRLTPAKTGLLLSAQPLAMALVASPSGWLSDRIGTRPLAVAGMVTMAVGLLGLSWLGPESSHLAVGGWLVLIGLGTGVFISPNSSALMGAAPRTQQGVAGSILAVSRTLGMLLGVAVATAIFAALGGHTGDPWRLADTQGTRWAFRVAGGVAILGAVTSWVGSTGATPRDPDEIAPLPG